jgi:hypothetical protein
VIDVAHDVALLTVCVSGGGASMDNAWLQKKLESIKILGNGSESPPSSAHCDGLHPCVPAPLSFEVVYSK